MHPTLWLGGGRSGRMDRHRNQDIRAPALVMRNEIGMRGAHTKCGSE